MSASGRKPGTSADTDDDEAVVTSTTGVYINLRKRQRDELKKSATPCHVEPIILQRVGENEYRVKPREDHARVSSLPPKNKLGTNRSVPGTLKCSYCLHTFETASEMTIHMKFRSKRKDCMKLCVGCSSLYHGVSCITQEGFLSPPSKKLWLMHLEITDSNRCTICNEVFKTVGSMRMHRTKIHIFKEKQSIQCVHCNAVFQTVQQFTLHKNECARDLKNRTELTKGNATTPSSISTDQHHSDINDKEIKIETNTKKFHISRPSHPRQVNEAHAAPETAHTSGPSSSAQVPGDMQQMPKKRRRQSSREQQHTEHCHSNINDKEIKIETNTKKFHIYRLSHPRQVNETHAVSETAHMPGPSSSAQVLGDRQQLPNKRRRQSSPEHCGMQQSPSVENRVQNRAVEEAPPPSSVPDLLRSLQLIKRDNKTLNSYHQANKSSTPQSEQVEEENVIPSGENYRPNDPCHSGESYETKQSDQQLQNGGNVERKRKYYAQHGTDSTAGPLYMIRTATESYIPPMKQCRVILSDIRPIRDGRNLLDIEKHREQVTPREVEETSSNVEQQHINCNEAVPASQADTKNVCSSSGNKSGEDVSSNGDGQSRMQDVISPVPMEDGEVKVRDTLPQNKTMNISEPTTDNHIPGPAALYTGGTVTNSESSPGSKVTNDTSTGGTKSGHNEGNKSQVSIDNSDRCAPDDLITCTENEKRLQKISGKTEHFSSVDSITINNLPFSWAKEQEDNMNHFSYNEETGFHSTDFESGINLRTIDPQHKHISQKYLFPAGGCDAAKDGKTRYESVPIQGTEDEEISKLIFENDYVTETPQSTLDEEETYLKKIGKKLRNEHNNESSIQQFKGLNESELSGDNLSSQQELEELWRNLPAPNSDWDTKTASSPEIGQTDDTQAVTFHSGKNGESCISQKIVSSKSHSINTYKMVNSDIQYSKVELISDVFLNGGNYDIPSTGQRTLVDSISDKTKEEGDLTHGIIKLNTGVTEEPYSPNNNKASNWLAKITDTQTEEYSIAENSLTAVSKDEIISNPATDYTSESSLLTDSTDWSPLCSSPPLFPDLPLSLDAEHSPDHGVDMTFDQSGGMKSCSTIDEDYLGELIDSDFACLTDQDLAKYLSGDEATTNSESTNFEILDSNLLPASPPNCSDQLKVTEMDAAQEEIEIESHHNPEPSVRDNYKVLAHEAGSKTPPEIDNLETVNGIGCSTDNNAAKSTPTETAGEIHADTENTTEQDLAKYLSGDEATTNSESTNFEILDSNLLPASPPNCGDQLKVTEMDAAQEEIEIESHHNPEASVRDNYKVLAHEAGSKTPPEIDNLETVNGIGSSTDNNAAKSHPTETAGEIHADTENTTEHGTETISERTDCAAVTTRSPIEKVATSPKIVSTDTAQCSMEMDKNPSYQDAMMSVTDNVLSDITNVSPSNSTSQYQVVSSNSVVTQEKENLIHCKDTPFRSSITFEAEKCVWTENNIENKAARNSPQVGTCTESSTTGVFEKVNFSNSTPDTGHGTPLDGNIIQTNNQKNISQVFQEPVSSGSLSNETQSNELNPILTNQILKYVVITNINLPHVKTANTTVTHQKDQQEMTEHAARKNVAHLNADDNSILKTKQPDNTVAEISAENYQSTSGGLIRGQHNLWIVVNRHIVPNKFTVRKEEMQASLCSTAKTSDTIKDSQTTSKILEDESFPANRNPELDNGYAAKSPPIVNSESSSTNEATHNMNDLSITKLISKASSGADSSEIKYDEKGKPDQKNMVIVITTQSKPVQKNTTVLTANTVSLQEEVENSSRADNSRLTFIVPIDTLQEWMRAGIVQLSNEALSLIRTVIPSFPQGDAHKNDITTAHKCQHEESEKAVKATLSDTAENLPPGSSLDKSAVNSPIAEKGQETVAVRLTQPVKDQSSATDDGSAARRTTAENIEYKEGGIYMRVPSQDPLYLARNTVATRKIKRAPHMCPCTRVFHDLRSLHQHQSRNHFEIIYIDEESKEKCSTVLHQLPYNRYECPCGKISRSMPAARNCCQKETDDPALWHSKIKVFICACKMPKRQPESPSLHK